MLKLQQRRCRKEPHTWFVALIKTIHLTWDVFELWRKHLSGAIRSWSTLPAIEVMTSINPCPGQLSSIISIKYSFFSPFYFRLEPYGVGLIQASSLLICIFSSCLSIFLRIFNYLSATSQVLVTQLKFQKSGTTHRTSKLTIRIWNTNCKYNICPSLQPKLTCVISFFVILMKFFSWVLLLILQVQNKFHVPENQLVVKSSN